MLKSDLVRIRHMLDATNEVIAFVKGKQRKDLDSDRMLNLSLVRLIEIIGEAASHVSPESQSQYTSIPWPDIIGMRHRLIHGYDDIDFDILWEVVARDLPVLLKELEQILSQS